MKKIKIKGFDYYLSKETIKRYQGKPPELRLRWLYMGSLLRKGYNEKIIEVQNSLREGNKAANILKPLR